MVKVGGMEPRDPGMPERTGLAGTGMGMSRSLNNLPKVLVTDFGEKNHLLSRFDESKSQSTPCSPRVKRRAFTTCIAGTRYVIGKLYYYKSSNAGILKLFAKIVREIITLSGKSDKNSGSL